MGLTFFDSRRGECRDFLPAAAPAVGVAAGDGLRERAVAESLGDVLVFLGLRPGPGREILVGGEDSEPGAFRLAVAPLTGAEDLSQAALAAHGFSWTDFRFLCAQTHYRRALAFAWETLAAARAEREHLQAEARALSALTLEPSARALTGYLHRFRECAARDLDLPQALACVWDGLRPGALSPGSRAALLRRALPALGLPAR